MTSLAFMAVAPAFIETALSQPIRGTSLTWIKSRAAADWREYPQAGTVTDFRRSELALETKRLTPLVMEQPIQGRCGWRTSIGSAVPANAGMECSACRRTFRETAHNPRASHPIAATAATSGQAVSPSR
jgi:hypothetical protein